MTALPTRSPDPSPPSLARTAGRGGLAVALGKGYFILIGFVQQVALKRVLGLDGFGALSSALSIAGIAYNPVVSTSIQGVSRAVAQAGEGEQPAVIRKVLSIHALFTVPLALLFLLFAGPIGHASGMPHVVPGLRIMSGVMLCYGFYSPLIGVVNGQKKFVWQAAFDIAFATLRTVALLGGGYWFSQAFHAGVEGASFGFVAAAAVICGAALLVVGVGKSGLGGPSLRQYLGFIGPLLVGQVLLNLLLQADLTMLRFFAAGAAQSAGLPLQAADPLVGAYRATQLFSFLPYQLLISVTFVLFPLLASTHREGNAAAVRHYVETGVRIALLVAGAMVSVTSGLAEPLLRLVFGQDTSELAGRSLQLLALGFGAFAVFGILTTVLNSLGRERVSTAITALAFALVTSLSAFRVQGGPFGEELLWRTASSTSLGIILATLVAGSAVYRVAGGVVPLASLARVLLALGVAIGVPHLLQGQIAAWGSGLVVFAIEATGIGLLYLAVLLVSRELTPQDWKLVRGVVQRRRGAEPS